MQYYEHRFASWLHYMLYTISKCHEPLKLLCAARAWLSNDISSYIQIVELLKRCKVEWRKQSEQMGAQNTLHELRKLVHL